MTGTFERVLLPVANPADADATADALLAHLGDDVGTVVAITVVEKGGGAMDKAPLERMEELATDALERVSSRLATAGVAVETERYYGTDVVETIRDAAAENEVSAIAFTPREANRWVRLLSGNTTYDLVTGSQRPVVVLPAVEDESG